MLANIVSEKMASNGGIRHGDEYGSSSRPFTPEFGGKPAGGTRSSTFFTDLRGGNIDMDSDEYNNALFAPSVTSASGTNSRTATPPVKTRHKNGHQKMNMPMNDLLALAKTFTLDPKDRIAGGIAGYSKVETGKYFGVEAKAQFGKHCKAMYNQRNITQSHNSERLPAEVLQVMDLVSPQKDSPMRKALSDTPFSPDRPPLPYKMNTKVVIRTQSLGAESLYSEMKLVQKPVELQSFDHLLQSPTQDGSSSRPEDAAYDATAAMLQSPMRTPRLEPLALTGGEATPDSARKKHSANTAATVSFTSPSKPKQLPPLQAALLKNFEQQHQPPGDAADATAATAAAAPAAVVKKKPTAGEAAPQLPAKASPGPVTLHEAILAATAAVNSGAAVGAAGAAAAAAPFAATIHSKRQSLRRVSSIFGGLTVAAPRDENEDVSLHDLAELYKVHKHAADADRKPAAAADGAAANGNGSRTMPAGARGGRKASRKASMTAAAQDVAKSNYSGSQAVAAMPTDGPMLELVCVDYRDPHNRKIVDRLRQSNSLFQYVEQKTLQRDFYDENDSDGSDVEDEIRLLRQHRDQILATNPTRLATAAVTKQRRQQQQLQKKGVTGAAAVPAVPIRVNRMKLQAAQRQELRGTGRPVSLSSRVTATPPAPQPEAPRAYQAPTAAFRKTAAAAGGAAGIAATDDAFAAAPRDAGGDLAADASGHSGALITMWNDGDDGDDADGGHGHGHGDGDGGDGDGAGEGGEYHAGRLSPRSMFIDNCLRAHVNPRATLILRKIYTRELNLKHLGMGNAVACLLAEAIVHVPYIESLNVCDNNLTDPGLTAIVDAIVAMRRLTVLDMSFNEIGPDAAKALYTYLSAQECPLTRLILEKADVDDDECRDFVQALHHNVNLRELTLNDNKVGSSENLNTVMPDIVTGGEAIAELLRSENCPLTTLRLGWNMIRLGGAAELCQSLSMNQSLTFLELSYNALGVSGGIALGDALQDNKVLRHLLVANNSLDSVATMVICAGILENANLEYVCFDENPIGQQGAMVLMVRSPTPTAGLCVCLSLFEY